MPNAPRIPAYCLHKASGQAVVRLNGRDVYLGGHDTPESKAFRAWHIYDLLFRASS